MPSDTKGDGMDYAIEVLERRKRLIHNNLKGHEHTVEVLIFFGEDPKHIHEERLKADKFKEDIATLDKAIAILREAK